MDSIRISKVQDVLCTKRGTSGTGTLHLTAHHLIFCPTKEALPINKETAQSELDEVWIPYPLINLVTRLPLTIQGNAPLSVQTRIFTSYLFQFAAESDALDVWESVKGLTVVTTITQLYAFSYSPMPPLPHSLYTDPQSGWRIYNPREEFTRMGVGARTRGWRFTDLNKDYSLCPTYPSLLCVPTRISDSTLTYGSKYRTKNRLPALTYLHWNLGTITRCSQPMIGLTNARSIQDEKLVEAIFTSHHSSNTRVSASSGGDLQSSQSLPSVAAQTHIYGSTPSCLIIDARPTANAFANAAKGGGTENMEYYKDGKKAYVGLDNIHVMRDSLNKVCGVLKDGELLEEAGGSMGATFEIGGGGGWIDRGSLRRTGWLRHLAALLEGARLMTRAVHIQASHVMIHCSDGWDRTSQLSALTQVCLDPYYRTLKGFAVLVEKDWASFGHMFGHRCGHLSSEKIFLSPPAATGGGAEFLASMQTKFGGGQQHFKETSPIFHQFLESTWNVLQQFPERFEFNAEFLQEIFYHVYSCQFGTFLFNCEQERMENLSSSHGPRLISIWDYLLSTEQRLKYVNASYDPTLDDHSRKEENGRYGDMGVLLPDPKAVKFWAALYGREDPEMNSKLSQIGKTVGPDIEIVEPIGGEGDDPVLTTEAGIASSLRQGLQRPVSTPPISPTKESSQPIASPGRTTPIPNFLAQSVSGAFAAMAKSSQSAPSPRKPPDQQASHHKEQSFRPFDTDSAFTMRTQNQTGTVTEASLSGTPTTRREPQAPQSLDNRMKSMWGKFSFNASAAFSAVQGAYDGVANEFRGLNLQGQPSPVIGGDRELAPSISMGSEFSEVSIPSNPSRHTTLPRSTLRTPSGQFTIPADDNPWATTAQRRAKRAGLDESPFRPQDTRERAVSVGARSQPSRTPLLGLQSQSDLPFDPTISTPHNPWTINSTTSPSQRAASNTPSNTREPENRDPPKQIDDSYDPLGVGGI